DNGVGSEEVGGELDNTLRSKRLAGIDVHAEEQQGLLPGVEMDSGRLPVDPAGPTVKIRTVSYWIEQGLHATYRREFREVGSNIPVEHRRRATSLDHEPLAADHRRQIGHDIVDEESG